MHYDVHQEVTRCHVASSPKWAKWQSIHNSAHQSPLRRLLNVLKVNNEMVSPENLMFYITFTFGITSARFLLRVTAPDNTSSYSFHAITIQRIGL